MPDRIYRLQPGQSLAYEISFKRKNADLQAIAADAPAVHRCQVRVSNVGAGSLTVALEGGSDNPSRSVELGDTLLETHRAIREVVAEASPDAAADLDDCALIFELRA
jgi:hypothetical protein